MSGQGGRAVLAALMRAQARGEAVVLATVVRARGSVPRHAGTKMLVYADGRILGTIGGGEMESRVIAAAADVLASGRPTVMPYSLVDPKAGDPGVCGGELEIYMEPYPPPATVLVVGCGHVGKAVAELAHWLGFQVAVTDDRVELASAEHIPAADIHLPGAITDALAEFNVTDNTYITVVTRNVAVDREILPHLVQTPAPYIGVMGSRRRWQTTLKQLRDDGVDDAALARLHAPLGLELNAESPEEIAVSILSEIIMLRRGGNGRRMAA